jgi:hypothetical protein
LLFAEQQLELNSRGMTSTSGASSAMSAGVMGFLREFQRQHSAPPRP